MIDSRELKGRKREGERGRERRGRRDERGRGEVEERERERESGLTGNTPQAAVSGVKPTTSEGSAALHLDHSMNPFRPSRR